MKGKKSYTRTGKVSSLKFKNNLNQKTIKACHKGRHGALTVTPFVSFLLATLMSTVKKQCQNKVYRVFTYRYNLYI